MEKSQSDWALYEGSLIPKSQIMSNYVHYDKTMSHITDAPKPVNSFNKLIQWLPLPALLIVTPIYVCIGVIWAIMNHLVNGPLKVGRTISVTIAHSMLKSLFEINPPQGRHSFWIIKYLSRWRFPNLLFKTPFEELVVCCEDSEQVHNKVCQALNIDQSMLKFRDVKPGKRELKGEWIPTKDSDTVILYLHGGAHYFLTPSSHRTITTRIAHLSNSSVFAPDYRLCPDHPFPHAVEDALIAYLALLSENTSSGFICDFKGYSPRFSSSKVYLMGDSSGGCLALQLQQVISAMNLPAPAGIILLSPFVDHSISSPSWSDNYHSDFLGLDLVGTKWAMDLYANGIPIQHSALSPMNLSETDNYPPILLQCGDSEVVTNDSIEFFKRNFTKSRIDLQVFAGMFHVFQAFPFVRQSGYALGKCANFISSTSIENYDAESIDSGETMVEGSMSTFVTIDNLNQEMVGSLKKLV